MTFELKAASQPEPITYAVKSDDVERTIQIERVEWTPGSDATSWAPGSRRFSSDSGFTRSVPKTLSEPRL